MKVYLASYAMMTMGKIIKNEGGELAGKKSRLYSYCWCPIQK